MHTPITILDAFEREVVFCIWFGKKIMPVNRAAALLSIVNNTNCPVCLIHDDNYRRYELAEHPFHPGFNYLTDTHKSDYLRVYIAYHFGGGYTDIKFTFNDWSSCFADLKNSDKHLLAYRENSPTSVCFGLIKKLNPSIIEQLQAAYSIFPGTSAFIFKRHSPMARELLGAMESILDQKLDDLKRNPGRAPQEFTGTLLEDKTVSAYPLDWVELLGDNFHYLAIFKHSSHIMFGDIAPSFQHYREFV